MPVDKLTPFSFLFFIPSSAKFKVLLLPQLTVLPLPCSFWPPSIPFCNTFLWLTHTSHCFCSCQSFRVPVINHHIHFCLSFPHMPLLLLLPKLPLAS